MPPPLLERRAGRPRPRRIMVDERVFRQAPGRGGARSCMVRPAFAADEWKEGRESVAAMYPACGGERGAPRSGRDPHTPATSLHAASGTQAGCVPEMIFGRFRAGSTGSTSVRCRAGRGASPLSRRSGRVKCPGGGKRRLTAAGACTRMRPPRPGPLPRSSTPAHRGLEGVPAPAARPRLRKPPPHCPETGIQ